MRLHEVLRLERPLIGLDTETTGTNPKTARIVELGLEIMRPDGRVKEYRTYINPGIPIPPETTAVHHITDDMVKDAPTFEQIADNLVQGLTDVDFAGYNIKYDLQVLTEEMRRARKQWSYEGARILDGFRLWQVVQKRSLDDAVEAFLDDATKNEVTGDSHTALADTKRATRVIAAQIKKFGILPRDIGKLHDVCNPGMFDVEGKLKWKNGELCIAFGQHRDVPLRDVPRGYLKWMYQADFSRLVKETIKNAANGIFPKPPEGVDDEEA